MMGDENSEHNTVETGITTLALMCRKLAKLTR